MATRGSIGRAHYNCSQRTATTAWPETCPSKKGISHTEYQEMRDHLIELLASLSPTEGEMFEAGLIPQPQTVTHVNNVLLYLREQGPSSSKEGSKSQKGRSKEIETRRAPSRMIAALKEAIRDNNGDTSYYITWGYP